MKNKTSQITRSDELNGEYGQQWYPPSCKILVAYHKPGYLLKNEIYIPIHAGRAVAREQSKDGMLPPQEIQWLYDNMIGDDTGENISTRNRYYSEMTAVYWAWKNFDKLDNPDFIGLNHYSRFFTFKPDIPNKDARLYPSALDDDIAEEYLTLKWLPSLLREYDMIIPRHFPVPQGSVYDLALNRGSYDYDDALALMREKYPDYIEAAENYLHSTKGLFCNIFIMRRELFFRYCEYIFGILKPLDEKARRENKEHEKLRRLGYIAEILTGIFLHQAICERKYRVKAVPVLYPRDTSILLDLEPIFSQNSVAITLGANSGNVHLIGVLLMSIIANSSIGNNYDLVIMENGLSNQLKDQLCGLSDGHRHIKIRFYNVRQLIKAHGPDVPTIKLDHPENYRFFVSDIFKHYSRVICLNGTIIVNADLAELFHSEDMNDRFVAAVQDFAIIGPVKSGYGTYPSQPYYVEIVGVAHPFDQYFQTDVLLFNLDEMRKGGFLISLLNSLAQNSFATPYQDAMNQVCAGRVRLLDSAWSVMSREGKRKQGLHVLPLHHLEKWNQDARYPRIVSYCPGVEPWIRPDAHLAELWWHYARKSPFYESIMLSGINIQIRQFQKKETATLRSLSVPARTRLFILHHLYMILAFICRGKNRDHFVDLRRGYANQRKTVRRLLLQRK